MHVLHIEAGRHLYGGALQVVYLLEGLSERGIRSTLICSAGSEMAERARGAAQRIHAIPWRGELDPAIFFRLLAILRGEKPDLVHVHSRRGADLWGGLAARALGFPAVVTRRVDNPEIRLSARIRYRLYERVITISGGIRRVVLDAGVPEEKVVCVRSAIHDDWLESTCDRAWFRDSFGLGGDGLTVGVIAQLIPRKGHRIILAAAPMILARHPDAVLLFFGQGPLEGELKGMCRELGLADRVRFAGFRKDLRKILPCLDLVVHPALMEGLGVSLIQAAACGVPIVASRAGGIPEIVRDGLNGILVDPGDPSALADAVNRLLGDDDLRSGMGSSGRELVRREFGLEQMIEGNLRVYREVLGES